MHPTDLAEHQQARHRKACRHMLRDAHRLAPHLTGPERAHLQRVCDLARDQALNVTDVHAGIRQQLSHHARRAA